MDDFIKECMDILETNYELEKTEKAIKDFSEKVDPDFKRELLDILEEV